MAVKVGINGFGRIGRNVVRGTVGKGNRREEWQKEGGESNGARHGREPPRLEVWQKTLGAIIDGLSCSHTRPACRLQIHNHRQTYEPHVATTLIISDR